MGEKQNAYRILVINLKRRDQLRNFGISGMILKWITRK
jgi:hypothetical protein